MPPFRRAGVALTLAFVVAVAAAAGCSTLLDRSNLGIEILERGPAPVRAVATGSKYVGWVVSAPLVVAMLPVAALAWATPWVDLATAVDVATAPSLALGYALEAAIGFPALGALFWVDDPDSAPVLEAKADSWVPPDDEVVPWGFVVAHRPRPSGARAALPLPAERAAYYAPPAGSVERLRAELDGALRDLAAERDPISVPLPAGLPGTLELYPASDGDPRPRPLVLLTPPSEGTFAARYLARRYARGGGVHGAVIVPDEEVFLDPSLEAAGIEAKLRATAVAARTVVAALAARPEVACIRYLGISAGGIFGTILLALEPSVERAVLVLPGGDLASLVATSDLRTVVAYREAWAARGVDDAALARAFARDVRTEPLDLARHVDPARVILFLGRSDRIVPIEGGLALRRALGCPETYVLAGNHETATLCFGFILRRADEFLLGCRARALP